MKKLFLAAILLVASSSVSMAGEIPHPVECDPTITTCTASTAPQDPSDPPPADEAADDTITAIVTGIVTSIIALI